MNSFWTACVQKEGAFERRLLAAGKHQGNVPDGLQPVFEISIEIKKIARMLEHTILNELFHSKYLEDGRRP